IFFGALVLNMVLVSPVCHLHYFCLTVPLVMGLLAASWEGGGGPRLGIGLALVLGVNLAANVLPQFPLFQVLRDAGLAMYGGLLLWAAGLVEMGKENWRRPAGISGGEVRLPRAA